MSFKKDVIQSLSKIEQQLAVNTEILDQHHKRSTMLEERVKPLEDGQMFFNKLVKVFMGLVTVTAGIAAAYKYLLH